MRWPARLSKIEQAAGSAHQLNLLTYMDSKNGAEELIAKILQDPTLLKSLSQLPKNDESAKGSEE